jgi:hypothetical protein
MTMAGDLKSLGRHWWSHGGGGAVIMLFALVSVNRPPRTLIFWAALVFLAVHTLMAVRSWYRDRAFQSTATVTRHHRAQARTDYAVPFLPMPVNSLISPQVPPKRRL